mgnify:CR=1 FL=1
MNRRNVLLVLGGACAASFAFGAAAQACGPEPAFTKPVRFAPGSNEASIRQTIKGDHTHEWVLTGKPGQKVEIALDARKSALTLMPDEAAGGKPKWGAAPKDGRGVKRWSGTLPKSGRLLIEVTTEAGRDSYALAIKRA